MFRPLKKITLRILGILTLCTALFAQARDGVNFDRDWKFALGDTPAAAESGFDDSGWRPLALPHDWSIEGTHHKTAYGTDWQTGFLPAGIGWYRKSFDYDGAWDGRVVRILFDGVHMNSSVWINGHLLGTHPYGYTSFEYDLTPFLSKGKNVIAVKVDTSKPKTARWYAGSGIYRHVWIIASDKILIPTWGVYFTTPKVSKESASAEIRVKVRNLHDSGRDVTVSSVLRDNQGRKVAEASKKLTLAPGGQEQEASYGFEVANPKLWSPLEPNLYALETAVTEGASITSTQTLNVGFRSMKYNATEGMLLNGVPVKLKGVCEHHAAGGGIGAAVPDQVLERRLRLLKQMGCNAIRTAHNPASPEFYDLCDALGIMVMDEAFDGWEKPKAADDYGNYFNEWWQRDLGAMLLRDRNHPCVLFWSIGNEVRGATPETQRKLANFVHDMDPTRPVTQGGADPTRGQAANYDKNIRYLDLVGFNGNGEEIGELEKFHKMLPDRCAVGTEMPHTYQTRSVYRTQTAWRGRDFTAPWESGLTKNWAAKWGHRVFPIPDLSGAEVFPEEKGNAFYQSSYDNASVRISARQCWQRVEKFPWLLGMFRWVGFDYYGEAEWPQRLKSSGVLDACGFPKDHYYLYKSLWSDEPMAHILPHWTLTGKEGTKIPVVVYTNCDRVELFLNGRSLGEKTCAGGQLVWQVPFEKGEIKAVARKGGATVETSQRTSEGARQLRMTADKNTVRANKTDVAHVEINITDEKGTFYPHGSNEINFEITGAGKLLAVDNGDPLDLSSCAVPHRKAFRGKALLIIQSTGEKGTITVKASSAGLKPDVLTVEAR